MLTLRLLAARSRQLPVFTTAKCASAIANTLRNNVAQVSSRETLLNPLKSRCFSSVDGPKDQNTGSDNVEATEDVKKPQDGQLSSLEQLAQNFHLETDLDDVLEDDLDDLDDTEDHEKKNIFSNEWTSENTVDAGSKYSERRRFEVAQSRLARAAYNHLRDTELEELDFDSELERVWGTRELKERKFHQALRREQDRDHVCSNCGERGHRPRNCLVPLICSNCGNLGHTSGNCRYRTLRSVDEMVKEDKEREENSKKRKEDHKTLLKKIKIANRGTATRPEVPTTDLDKRNNQLRLELESELDEYANKLERAAERRKEKKKD